MRAFATAFAMLGMCLFTSLSAEQIEENIAKTEKKFQFKRTKNKETQTNNCCYFKEAGIFEAEFLYWNYANNGFFPGTRIQLTGGDVRQKIQRPSNDWGPGFRLTAGWQTASDQWDLKLCWTRFHETTSDTYQLENTFYNANIATGYFFTSYWSLQPTVAYPVMTTKIQLHYNELDLEWGRPSFFGKQFYFRPFFSVTCGWLNQLFEATYKENLLAALPLVNLTATEKFTGLGPRVGFEGKWTWGYGLGAIGKLAGTVLWGKTRVNQFAVATEATTASNNGKIRIEDTLYQIAPNLGASVGIGWESCLNADRLFMDLSASWEANCWWDHFHLYGSPQPTNFQIFYSKAVILQGLTLKARLNF